MNYSDFTMTIPETFKSSFFSCTIKNWNLLNEIVKSSTAIGEFKSCLCTELFSLDQHCYNCNYPGNRKVNAIFASVRTKCSVLK